MKQGKIMLCRKISCLLFITISFGLTGFTQESKIDIDSTRLKKQAIEMAESFIRSDYKTFVKYTYPIVVKMMGGEEKMISTLTEGIAQMKAEGYGFKSVEIGLTPLRAKAGKEIHSIVSQTLVMTVPGGILTSKAHLLAITQDNGISWTFVDTAPFTDIEKIKAIIPDYNPELKIPGKQPPVFSKKAD